MRNALVISGKCIAAWFFFGNSRGLFTFTQCTNAIPKLHPRHYKTLAVTPELAVIKTSRKRSDSLRLSFGAQIAKQDAPVIYAALQYCERCDWKPKPL
jgi:hypothetical protein